MQCSRCGYDVPDWARFCRQCGNPAPVQVPRQSVAPGPEPTWGEDPAMTVAPPAVYPPQPAPPPPQYYQSVSTLHPQIPAEDLPTPHQVFPDPETEAEPAGALAVGSFVLGLMAMLFFFVGAMPGVPAAALGLLELARIRKGKSPESGRGLSMAGIALGVLGAAFFALVMVFILGDPLR